MKYLLNFLIGSSWFVTLPFFIAVNNMGSIKSYSYFDYTTIAPVYLGFWNIISLIIAKKLNFSLRERLLFITPITYILSNIAVKILKSYNYTDKEWNLYDFKLFVTHFIIWNIIVYYIEKNIT